MKVLKHANILVHHILAATFSELENGFELKYIDNYDGPPISLTLPTSTQLYQFETFPAFFDGVLPEGEQLEGLLRNNKLDRNDFFGQLIAIGSDLVGAVTVEAQS